MAHEILTFSQLHEEEELNTLIFDLISEFETSNKDYRERKLKEWHKSELYWEGVQRLWWSDSAGEWRYPEIASRSEKDENDLDDLDDRTVNIYSAHGESIIAALTSSVPGVRFYPDNAESEDDLSTAEAFGKISDLIKRHNDFQLLYTKALFILYHQDYVAAHIYNEQSEDFGVRKEEIVEDEITKEVEVPKTRTVIDVFGGTHINIIPYARKQKELPYLILKSEHHFSAAVAAFGEDDMELQRKLISDQGGSSDSSFEREARTPTDSYDLTGENTVTIREAWIRPWAFFALAEEKDDQVKELRKNFPTGLKASFVNDTLVRLQPAQLDKNWVVYANPLSNYLIGKSLGKSLVPIQEMTSELNELTLQTIEHGIPLSFADSEVVDFDAINNQRAAPGLLHPAAPKSGRGLRESFYTSEKSSLSREVAAFNDYLDSASQFVTGDVPSLHGGASTGSKTASEYSQSRQNALQRLGLVHLAATSWTARIFDKAVRMYVEQMKGDENFVEHRGKSFFNTWILQKDLQGSIGHVEPVGSDSFPISPEQMKETLFRLFEIQSPVIQDALLSPENVHLLSRAFGLTGLTFPGEDDRAKQWAEIHKLVSAQPLQEEQVDELGQPIQKTSIPVDPLIDDHAIEASICSSFLKSAEGRALKEMNPLGYFNVLLHLQEHQTYLMEESEAQSEEEIVEEEEGIDG